MTETGRGPRYLWGPVTSDNLADNLASERALGRCATFGPAGAADAPLDWEAGWDALAARCPGGPPDFLALYLPYASVPPALWAAPVPVVALAPDANLLWHHYRRALPLCDLVLTDAPSARKLRAAGLQHVEAAPLFGGDRALLEHAWPDAERDIDVLFVGNLDRAVQRRRLPWLGRLAALAGRYNVVIASGAFGADYYGLLARARVVFNRSVRGECNRRVWEAAAAGALLFQEEGNLEVPGVLRGGEHCVYYTEENLEERLAYYLENEGERRKVAAAAHALAAGHGFAAAWQGVLARVEAGWDELCERARRRVPPAGEGALAGRLWQLLSSADAADRALERDLEAALAAGPGSAHLHNALGLILARLHRAPGGIAASLLDRVTGCFRRAAQADPDHVPARLNLAEALLLAGRRDEALPHARGALGLLDRGAAPDDPVWGGGHFPPGFDLFRVEWERAGWDHPGDPAAEARDKAALLRCRAHTLLAELTAGLPHFYEAVLARPDLPVARAALGCALARAGQAEAALPHLRRAADDDPLDRPAARALAGALEQAGRPAELRELLRRQRLLRRAAPQAVPDEPWLADRPPPPDALASLVILCCNELEYTRQCLESVLARTRPPFELVLVDNGSSDGTPDYLRALQGRLGPDRVRVLRNGANLGFAAGCNQGLAAARGEFLVLLNNDTVVTEGWLEGLLRWALADWPRNGLVGAVTNYASPPQQVEAGYQTLAEMERFAARRRAEYAGRATEVERLVGFCLLLRRDVLEAVGGLDERFGLGFFEDDDWGVRARRAGFRLLVAEEVFVHHYGSRTIAGLGLDPYRQLEENFALFKAKWGEEYAAGYRLPERPEQQRPQPGPADEPVVVGAPAAGDRPSVSLSAVVRGGGADLGRRLEAAGEFRESAADVDTGVTGPAAPRPRASLCMIVRDGGAGLERCLASAADLFDETVVVVDSRTTDGSREVAARFGARVVEFDWCDSFAAARNESLRHATGEWILWLDADEYLDGENRERVRGLLRQLPAGNVAFTMRQSSPLAGGASAETAVDQVRLFRNLPNLRWRYRVHEQILLGLRELGAELAHTDVVIRHAGFADPAAQGHKAERNLRLLQLEAAERPEDAFVLYNLGAVHLSLGRPDEASGLLGRSLALCAPGDTLTPKLHALLVRAAHQGGRPAEALERCRRGRGQFPRDGELLFWEALLRREAGDPDGCAGLLRELLRLEPGRTLTGADAGLHSYRARHLLADTLRLQGELSEAESEWRSLLRDFPEFLPAWQELARLYLEAGRLAEAGQALHEALERHAGDPGLEALRERLRQTPAAGQGKSPTAVTPAYDAAPAGPEGPPQVHDTAGATPAPDAGTPAPPRGAARERPPAEPRGRASASLTMIVKDEEENLPACLESVAGLDLELVVVDTGSSDRTREVARRFGARVFDFPWCDSFAAARNEALRHATGDWVFWMDADDRLDAENRARLLALLARLDGAAAGYVMECLCLPDPVSRSATRVDHLRLFRNLPGLRWRYRVHEQILPALLEAGADIRWSDVVVRHTGYQDPALRARKLGRDLRLLELERAERPDDPFTLFNLGSVRREQGQFAEAAALFRRSLDLSEPRASIVRKLYALLAQCHGQRGEHRLALEACREGRRLYPEDAELLFRQGVAHRERGEAAEAEASWLQLLRLPPGRYLASVEEGLRTHLPRHNLALLCEEQGRLGEAREHWEAALRDSPDYLPAHLGLAGLALRQGRWAEAERIRERLLRDPDGRAEGRLLEARLRLARREFGPARQILEELRREQPQALGPPLFLSHALLQEGRDLPAAEAALRAVLALDPKHAEARGNLKVLLRELGRPAEADDLDGPT